jgi:hypothetical protein
MSDRDDDIPAGYSKCVRTVLVLTDTHRSSRYNFFTTDTFFIAIFGDNKRKGRGQTRSKVNDSVPFDYYLRPVRINSRVSTGLLQHFFVLRTYILSFKAIASALLLL